MQWYGIVRRHIQWFLIRWFCHAGVRRSNLLDWEIAKDFHHCLDYFNSKDENFNLSSPIGWRYESTRNLTRAEINNCRNMKICHLYYFKFQISNFLLPTWYFLDYPRGILGVGSRKKSRLSDFAIVTGLINKPQQPDCHRYQRKPSRILTVISRSGFAQETKKYDENLPLNNIPDRYC